MNKKEEILENAKKLFSEKGYNFPVSVLAEKVSLKKQSLYSHFRNKDEIVYTIVEKEVLHFFESAESNLKENFRESFNIFLKNFFYFTIKYFENDETYLFWKWAFLIDNPELKNKCFELIKKNYNDFFKLFESFFSEHYRNTETDYQKIINLFFVSVLGTLETKFLNSTIKIMEVQPQNIWNQIEKIL